MAEKKPTKKPAVKKLSGDAKNIIEGKLLDASDEPKPKKPKINQYKKDKAKGAKIHEEVNRYGINNYLKSLPEAFNGDREGFDRRHGAIRDRLLEHPDYRDETASNARKDAAKISLDDPVHRSFTNWADDVADPLKKMQSRPTVNKSTSTGVPELRKLGNPESVFGAIPAPVNSMKPPPRPPVSLPDERISQPPQPRMSASEPPPAPPMPPSGGQGPGFLDKFREGLAPAAAGAANWDPAYNPENDVPTWMKDDEASRFEERRAGNAAKEDWYRSQNPLQIKANLEQAATQQGDPNMRNIDPVEFWRSLQGRK